MVNIWTPARAHRDPAAASLGVLAGIRVPGEPGRKRSAKRPISRFPGSLPAGTNDQANIVAGQEAVVGFYGERVLPRILNAACGTKAVEPLRRRVCGGLAGAVVEIGFGSGLNVPFYPAAIIRVAAVEPSDTGWKLAAGRLGATAVPVERSGLDGQSLPFPDDSYDAALSTWTLCTIPDVAAALAEIRRVLKPGATLHFLEHGLAPDESVRRWQRRLDPLEQRIAGGCHFTRPVINLLTTAGFTIEELDVFYEQGAPKFAGADSLGTATSP
jgi:SAM-dependent methyltransferase